MPDASLLVDDGRALEPDCAPPLQGPLDLEEGDAHVGYLVDPPRMARNPVTVAEPEGVRSRRRAVEGDYADGIVLVGEEPARADQDVIRVRPSPQVTEHREIRNCFEPEIRSGPVQQGNERDRPRERGTRGSARLVLAPSRPHDQTRRCRGS